MQAARTHQSVVRQKKANPRKRQSRPNLRNSLDIRRKHPNPRKGNYRIRWGNRRDLRPTKKRDRGRKRKIHRPRSGFLKGPKLAALVRVLRLRKMYISRFNSVTMPFDLYTFKGKVEERALVDSGATANFIDYKTVARLRLGTQKLDNIRTVKNIDGTLNRSGNITHCCDLLVSRDRKQERTRFFVTNLGGDRFIFGYPWLATFNPDINWPEGRVEGSRFRAETLIKGKLTQKEFLQHVQMVAIAQLEEGDELIMTVEVLEPEPMKIRKTTLAQQMAEKAYDSTKVNMEESVPTAFRRHWKVFSEQEARQLPPHRPWDHKIELSPLLGDQTYSSVVLRVHGYLQMINRMMSRKAIDSKTKT